MRPHRVALPIVAAVLLFLPWVLEVSCGSSGWHGSSGGEHVGSQSGLDLLFAGEAVPLLLVAWLVPSLLLAFAFDRLRSARRWWLIAAMTAGYGALGLVSLGTYFSSMCLFSGSTLHPQAGLELALLVAGIHTVAVIVSAFRTRDVTSPVTVGTLR